MSDTGIAIRNTFITSIPFSKRLELRINIAPICLNLQRTTTGAATAQLGKVAHLFNRRYVGWCVTSDPLDGFQWPDRTNTLPIRSERGTVPHVRLSQELECQSPIMK